MIGCSAKGKRLCISALVLNLCVIWGNSLLPGEISAAISGWVRDMLSFLLPEGDGDGGHGLLCKIGHFAEFACLGVLLGWLTGMRLQTIWRSATLSFACGFTAACIDELLQNLSPGRAPRFTDVLIDTAGVAVGIALLWLGYYIRKRKQNKKFGGNEK